MIIPRVIMIAAAIVAIDFVLTMQVARADEAFFPDLVFDEDRERNDFLVEWYSKHLKAMKERSL
jgi:hypothetical protein